MQWVSIIEIKSLHGRLFGTRLDSFPKCYRPVVDPVVHVIETKLEAPSTTGFILVTVK